MTLFERIKEIDAGLTLDGDYEYELAALNGIENDIPVYRHCGTPVWEIQQAKEEIARIRAWIADELDARGE